jgi:catechol 2,3-dioxygenase-like lactoylglutathione lyase family enzyme
MVVSRIGHMALRVSDLDAAVDFQVKVIGMVEVERVGRTSYLTCNERHHELMLIEDPDGHRGYDHIGLEVADAAALEAIAARVTDAGGTLLGPVHDGGPGIDRARFVRGPGGHVFKLFCGMATGAPPPPGDRPVKFEHVSVKARWQRPLERFLRDGLGFGLSDRMGRFASWWHCNGDHHGMAIALAPKPELAHYAYTFPDFASLGRAADRLAARGRKCVWGPSRHGPGNNHFLYFKDEDGALVECCSEIAQLPPFGGYQPRKWPGDLSMINQWGGPPPLALLRAGYPIAHAPDGR